MWDSQLKGLVPRKIAKGSLVAESFTTLLESISIKPMSPDSLQLAAFTTKSNFGWGSTLCTGPQIFFFSRDHLYLTYGNGSKFYKTTIQPARKSILCRGWSCWSTSCKFRFCPYSKIQSISMWLPTWNCRRTRILPRTRRKCTPTLHQWFRFSRAKDFLVRKWLMNRTNKKRHCVADTLLTFSLELVGSAHCFAKSFDHTLVSE